MRAEVVEKRLYGGMLKDLFGFVDIVALDRENKLFLGIQACDHTNVTHRYNKIVGECHDAAQEWLACGGKIFVYGWRKYKKPLPGSRKLWRPLVREVTEADL